MGKQEAIDGFRGRYTQVVNNLKSWSYFEWIFFFIIIPGILFLIYLLPQNIKDTFLIFDTTQLLRVQTYLVNEYTHSSFDHLFGNVKMYLIAIAAIFLFEDNKRRFKIMTLSALLLVPIIAAGLTIVFWHLIDKNTVSQGFSGITAAFMAYAMLSFVLWALHDALPLFYNPEKLKGKHKIGYYIMCGLVALALAMVLAMGLQLGAFESGENFVSNGIAHFGGFMTGVIVFLLCDLTLKERNLNLDAIFCLSIVIGVLTYIPYLLRVMEIAKGLK